MNNREKRAEDINKIQAGRQKSSVAVRVLPGRFVWYGYGIRFFNNISKMMRYQTGICIFAVFIFIHTSLIAAPVNSNAVVVTVRGWLKADAHPLGVRLGGKIQKVETFKDKSGEALYYVVYLSPSGFVIMPADDLVEPVICFSDQGKFDPSLTNSLGALINNDLPNRIASVRGDNATNQVNAHLRANRKWLRFQQLNQTNSYLNSTNPIIIGVYNGVSTVSDMRVAPLLQSWWDQATVNNAGLISCYNYYTPPYASGTANNYVCGCVATAMAQLMRYYQYPTTGVGTGTYTISTNEVSWFGLVNTRIPYSVNLRGGDGFGGPYDWSNMPLIPDNGISTIQCQAIGNLTYDAGLSVGMQYNRNNSGESGADGLAPSDAFKNTFFYSNAVKGYNNDSSIGSGLLDMVNPNLDAGCPVLFGINGPSGGHEIVCDGYGYDSTTLYHHLNMGWSGHDNAWYALPSFEAGYVFTNVYECVYNVFTNSSGEIISGRVVSSGGMPVADATVTASRAGGGTYSAITDTNGIYALAGIPSSSTYNISVYASGYSISTAVTNTGISSDFANTSGNVWGADFVLSVGALNNDQCAGAIPMILGVSYTQSTTNANSTNNPTPTCQEIFGKGVWFTYTATADGPVIFSSCGSDFDTVMQVYTGGCGALTPLANSCDDDDGWACAGGNASVLVASATAGTTYWILVGGYAGHSGNLSMTAMLPPLSNDGCGGAVALTDNVYYPENTVLATGDATPGFGSIYNGVWFTYTPSISGTVTVDTCGSDFDTVLEVMSGSCGALETIARNDDGTCGLQSSLTFAGSAGTTYLICAGGFSGNSGNLQVRAHIVSNLPDLTVISSVSAPSQATAGSSINISYTLKNIGDTPSGAFGVRVSLGTTTYGTQIRLDDFSTNSLAPNEQRMENRTVTIPAGVASGSYWVTVYVDGPAPGVVAESRENNNIGSSDPNQIAITVPPPVISVTVQTSPAGRTITVDGTNYTSTQVFSWLSGSSHTLTTPSPQSGGTGIQYVSNSGTTPQTVTPTTNITYTATFTTQYYLTMNAGTGGSVSPVTGWTNSGTIVPISAIANNGYSFSSWIGSGSGSYSGSSSSASVTVNAPITETASFTDTASPTMTITSPTSASTYSTNSSTLNIGGTASDNVGVTLVTWSNSGGGSGTASGTATWSVNGISLQSGQNIITVTAHDAAGNAGTATLTVTVTLSGAVLVNLLPTGAVSAGAQWQVDGGTMQNNGATVSGLSVGGHTVAFKAINGWITPANQTPTISANLTNTVTGTYVADTTKPTISITAPTAGQRWSNAVFTATGTAGDNIRVAAVWYQLNGTIWNTAASSNGWTNWTASLTLSPGTNNLSAYAVDSANNNSTTNTVSFDFVATNQLQIRAIGLGTISPNYSNAWLEIGRNYSMTATPGSGFVVTNWTISTNWLGGLITNNATLQFMMAPNLTLQINFADVTKPTLTVTTPTDGQKMTNALANLVGTASDNWKVTGVWYQLNSNAWNLVTTTNSYTNWTQTVTLLVGTNTLKAYALDLGGNFSTTNTLSVVSSNTFKLQLVFTSALPLKTNGLVFSLQLSTGLNGNIQVSTNLTSWVTLTNFVGTNTTLNFLDTSATNFSRRFYRAVTP